jgi:hypothetical protein
MNTARSARSSSSCVVLLSHSGLVEATKQRCDHKRGDKRISSCSQALAHIAAEECRIEWPRLASPSADRRGIGIVSYSNSIASDFGFTTTSLVSMTVDECCTSNSASLSSASHRNSSSSCRSVTEASRPLPPSIALSLTCNYECVNKSAKRAASQAARSERSNLSVPRMMHSASASRCGARRMRGAVRSMPHVPPRTASMPVACSARSCAC